MDLSKGDRVTVAGECATVAAFRIMEDESLIVLDYDQHGRRSYMLEKFEARQDVNKIVLSS